jgi:hypothetical protein
MALIVALEVVSAGSRFQSSTSSTQIFLAHEYVGPRSKSSSRLGVFTTMMLPEKSRPLDPIQRRASGCTQPWSGRKLRDLRAACSPNPTLVTTATVFRSDGHAARERVFYGYLLLYLWKLMTGFRDWMMLLEGELCASCLPSVFRAARNTVPQQYREKILVPLTMRRF